MHHLSIDLETYSSVPIAKAGAQKYISSPDFEILLFAYSVDGAPVEIIDLARGERLPPWLVQAITSPEYIKHAYNAPFEWGCLSKFLGTLPPDQWRCTMFHGLYCGYTAGLDATGKALGLAEDKRKLNTGKALIRYFCVPCAPTKANGGRTRNLPQHDTDKWELFKEYCRQDVVTEMEIERRLSAFPVPDFVQKQWETDLIINARGVAVDMDLVSGALYLGNVTRQNLTQEAMKISKLDNPNSVAQLTQWLQEAMGEELADLRKDTVARLLGKEDNSPQVQRMLEIRQELGKTSTKKYDAIEAAVCPDGRVRGLLQFYGANRTGRWAGRLVQVQNLPRTYTEPLPLARELVEHRKLDALRLIYGSVPDTLSQLIRTAFVAPEGHVLIDADFSAIEARVISWLAGEQWRLEVFRTHGKIYLWGKVKTYVATAIANIKLPSKTSDLTNDSGFITAKDVPEGAAASSTVPKMDGTAAAGTETAFARGDHVHPSDTTKVDKVEGKGLSANDYTNEEKAKLGGVEANANNYTLPDASASVKGGVTVGTNVDVSGGKISVKNGTTSQKGVVQLSSATDDASTTKAATPSAVKAAYDLAAGKQSPATSLAGYGIQDAYTKDEVDAKMSSALEYKGSKDTYDELPTTGNKKGDVWNIVNADAAHGVNAGDNVAWNGTTWDVLAGTVDLTAYMLASDLVAITNTELDDICK